jgi:hypothetical protein
MLIILGEGYHTKKKEKKNRIWNKFNKKYIYIKECQISENKESPKLTWVGENYRIKYGNILKNNLEKPYLERYNKLQKLKKKKEKRKKKRREENINNRNIWSFFLWKTICCYFYGKKLLFFL